MQDAALADLSEFIDVELNDEILQREILLSFSLASAKRFRYPAAKATLHSIIDNADPNYSNLYIAYWSLGEIYLREGDANASNSLLTDALALAENAANQAEIDLNLDKAGILSDLAESYIALELFADGESALSLALELGADSPALLSHIHNNRAFLFIRSSRSVGIESAQFNEMQDLVTEAHYLARLYAIEAEDTEAQLKAENNQAVHFLGLGETRKALAHYLNALELIDDDRFLEIKRAIAENVASSYQSLGDYSKSLTYINESIKIAAATNSPQISFSTCILGTTQRLLGDNEAAIEQHSRCALLALSQANGALYIQALRELSADYLNQSQYERAIFVAGIARLLAQNESAENLPREIENAITNTLESFSDWNNTPSQSFLAYSSAILNEHAKGSLPTEALEQILQIIVIPQEKLTNSRESDSSRSSYNIFELTQSIKKELLTSRATDDLRSADPESALSASIDFRIIDEEMKKLETQLALSLTSVSPEIAFNIMETALANSSRIGSPIAEIDALNAMTDIAFLNGREELGVRLGYQTIDRVQEFHEHLEAERLGPRWSDKTHASFTNLVDFLLEKHSVTGQADSLEAAFSVSERSRAISLRQRLAADFPNFSPDTEEQEQIEAISYMASLRADDSSEIDPSLLLKYNQQHDLVSLSRLANIDSLPVPKHIELGEVSSQIRVNQLFLNYISTESDLYVLVIDKSGHEIHSLGPIDELTDLANAVAQQLRNQNTFPIQATLTLSDRLLPDLARYSGITELIIVPDTGLNTVSFPSLSIDRTRYIPLVSKFSLRTTASISTFLMEKPGNKESSDAIAVIADPAFEAELPATIDEAEPNRSQLRNWAENRDRLPFTAIEAENLSSQFDDYTVYSFTGENANRAALTSSEVRNSKVLHLATHGYFKSTNNDNVGFALSAPPSSTTQESGFITLTELFGYSFSNELVVISGCDTSLGEELRGSGLNSLTRGFLAQGADNVISTLWPVDDRASAEFMRIFYENLRLEPDVAIALQLTQQTMFRNPEYRNPFFWAGYNLSSVNAEALTFN